MWNFCKRFKATLAYMLAIVILNKLFVVVPLFYVAGELMSPLDFVVGAIFVFRDFAQREIGHRVIFPMIIAGLFSYVLAAPSVATASVSAFIVSELIDWGVFTYTRKPLAQRLFWSAALSSPIDSWLFLHILGHANWLSVSVMTATKLLGVLVVISVWRRYQVAKREEEISSVKDEAAIA